MFGLGTLVGYDSGEFLLLANAAHNVNVVIGPHKLVLLYKCSPCDWQRLVSVEVKNILYGNVYCYTLKTVGILVQFKDNTAIACNKVVVDVGCITCRLKRRSLIGKGRCVSFGLACCYLMLSRHHVEWCSCCHNL